MARCVALAMALAAQLCVANGATLAATVAVATPAAAPAPAPGPAPVPAGTVGNVKIGLLVTGLSDYTNATAQALQAGVLTVANSAAPANEQLASSDVSLAVSSYAASISLVLQGLGLPQYPNNAAGNLCFEHSVSSVTGVPMADVSVRPPGGAPGGVAVPFYVYTTSAETADNYQTALDSLGSTNSAALVAHLASCGIACSGIQEATPPALAVYLTANIALDATDVATQANIVAAMGHPTAFVVAFRAQGIPTTASVQVTAAARYVAIPIPPPPRPPHPPRPPYPPGMAPHSPPPPKGDHRGPGASGAATASAGAAIAGAMLAAVAALAL